LSLLPSLCLVSEEEEEASFGFLEALGACENLEKLLLFSSFKIVLVFV
jgi:hypothetical protein